MDISLLERYTFIEILNSKTDKKYYAYLAYYHSNSKHICPYDSYYVCKALNLPFDSEIDGYISYCYQNGNNFYLGLSSNNLELIKERLNQIKIAVKNKGGIISEKPIQIRYWWTKFMEEHALKTITKWYLKIKYDPQYIYSRRRIQNLLTNNT